MPQTWTAQVFRLGSATVGQHNKWKKGWKQDPDDKTCHREIPERWKEKENLNGFQEKEKRSATKDPKKKKKSHQTSQQQSWKLEKNGVMPSESWGEQF